MNPRAPAYKRDRRWRLWAFFLWLLPLAASVSAAHGEEKDRGVYDFFLSGDYLIQAREIRYDSQSRVMEAVGAAEAARGKYTLTADRIRYDETKSRLEVWGDVRLHDGSGTVLSANYAVFEDGFEKSFLEAPAILWKDLSRVAAAYADRLAGDRSRLTSAVYSPCPICPKRGRDTPLWQITASEVIHYEQSQTVVYWNAFLEFFGVPVLYLPVFWHPSPDVERKTGFLLASLGNSSTLGFYYKQPFFWSITPSANLTFEPTYFADRGVLFDLLYRHRLKSGFVDLRGSAIWPREGERAFRGHFFGKGRFNIGQQARWGFDLRFTSDDTYLKSYNLDDSTELTSRLFVEWTAPRHRFLLSGYRFERLVPEQRPADLTGTERTPFAGPLMEYLYQPQRDFFGGDWSLMASFRALTRRNGIDSQRFSAGMSWERFGFAPLGSVLEFFAEMRGDLYSFSGGPREDRFQTRFLPLAGVMWRLPLLRDEGGLRQTLEPRLQFIYSDSFGDKAIPNEDSPTPEFDDTNLFSRNRFPGFDRWEDSLRLNAGLLYDIKTEDWGLSLLIGQSYRTRDSSLAQTAAGLEQDISDVVGRVALTQSDRFAFAYKFRFNHRSFELRRNEVDLNFSYEWLSVFLGYRALDASFGADLESPRSEIHAGSVARLFDNWRVYGTLRRDLENNRSIGYSLGIRYQDPCFQMDLLYKSDRTEDRDLRPERSLSFRVSLKGLGGGRRSLAR